MPSKILTRSRLSLSDEDLAWLGAITAYWAFGEQQVEMLIFILAQADLADGQEFLVKRYSFDQKIKNAKKLIRMRLSTAPMHEEIGIALMTKGKQLSEKRKRAGHWISQSNKPPANGLTFTDFTNIVTDHLEDMKIKTEIFTQAQIQDLVKDIADWSFEVARFPLLCFLNGLLSLNTTWHGPRLDGMALKWEDFHTIQKIPRSQTKT